MTRPISRLSFRTLGLHKTFTSLSEGRFLLLWVGLQVMSLASHMQMLTRTFLTYELTRSGVILAFVSASWTIPMLILGLFGGAIADRVDRKILIQAGQASIGIIAIFVGILITTKAVAWGHLIVAGFLQGCCWSTLNPARQAIIPQLVPADKLTNAMALTSAGMSLSMILAPAMGGLLYAAIGPDGVYYLVSAMLAIAVLITATVKSEPGRSQSENTSLIADVRVGISYMANRRVLLVILAVSMITLLLASPFIYVLPVFVVEVYGRDSSGFGVLVSMLGIGALMASLVVATLGSWKRGVFLIIGGFFSGTALFLIGAVPLYWAATFFMFLLGVGSVSHITLSQTLLMDNVEDEFRGRVASVLSMSTIVVAFGLVPIGVAVDMLGGRTVALAIGTMLLAISFVVFISQKQLRRLD